MDCDAVASCFSRMIVQICTDWWEPFMHKMMPTFSWQLWFRKNKKDYPLLHLDQSFWNRNLLTFIVRSQDMRKLYPRGDACRHFFFILLNYFQDYCVNELNILPLRFYCFHLSRWIKIAFLYTANIMIMSSVEYSF